MRDGIICIDKPAEHTSFDVIARVRGILHMKKVGHAGTLDPMTTGVLPVFLGRATKACDILPVQDKRYRARFQLGVTTDTQDCTGTVLERREVRVSREELIAAIRSFEGEQMQLPPMYSAIQVGGRRLYDIAREGGTVERMPRPVTFYSIEILDLGEDWAAVSYTHLVLTASDENGVTIQLDEENEMTFERSEAAYVRLVDNYDYASAELAEDSE